MAKQDLQARVRKMRSKAEKAGRTLVPARLQGVTKARVKAVLDSLDRGHPDIVEAVFALLDTRESWFPKAPGEARFCDGATTAHIGAHVGILQRRGDAKLDREGRDYWIKPLRDLGAVQPVYLDPKSRTFLPGHLRAKSPNCAYRLAEGFISVLKAPKDEWKKRLGEWAREDQIRARAQLQAKVAAEARSLVDKGHTALIKSCVDNYRPAFLPGYEVLYVDDGDGDRITKQDRERLDRAGLDLRLEDPKPDVLLWNPETDRMWVIEAVTSDGEVDAHKVVQVHSFTKRYGKAGVDFTTAYPTWKVAAARQHAYKNIAPGTYVWIAEDPSKHFKAEAFLVPPRVNHE